jgi:hypothetical protein
VTHGYCPAFYKQVAPKGAGALYRINSMTNPAEDELLQPSGSAGGLPKYNYSSSASSEDLARFQNMAALKTRKTSMTVTSKPIQTGLLQQDDFLHGHSQILLLAYSLILIAAGIFSGFNREIDK